MAETEERTRNAKAVLLDADVETRWRTGPLLMIKLVQTLSTQSNRVTFNHNLYPAKPQTQTTTTSRGQEEAAQKILKERYV